VEEKREVLQVLDRFESIQGEGINVGRYCTFIRLRGCNLECSWCDTKESWGMNSTASMCECLYGVDIALAIGTQFVVITGGEPLIYNIDELVKCLIVRNIQIAIETNGTIEPSELVRDVCWISCAPKLDADYRCIDADEYKIVVDDNIDEDVLPAILENIEAAFKGKRRHEPLIWLQPESNRPKMIEKVIELTSKFPQCRAGFQLHKLFNVK
jgi:7-carboxy-7-deazaguanine synthase